MSSVSLTSPFSLTSPQSDPVDTSTLASSTHLSSGAAGKTPNVDAVAADFEAVFISQMLSAMFTGDELTHYFGEGAAGDIYKSFLLNEYGKSMAKSGGIGIASQVKKELLKLQEVS